jgi:hypothetical protein
MIDIIDDPKFITLGKEESKWAVLVHEGVLITPTVKDAVLWLDISQTRGANWHGELRYSPFAVSAGDNFLVSFSARAKRLFKFSVWLGQQDAPYKSLVPQENHFGDAMMTADWQAFTHTWHSFLSEPEARLNFVFGQIDNIVEIKAVRLLRQ